MAVKNDPASLGRYLFSCRRAPPLGYGAFSFIGVFQEISKLGIEDLGV